MRLIDADRLLRDIADFPYGYRGMIKAVIANQPTIYPPAGYRVLPDGDGWEYRGACTASDYLDDNGRIVNNPSTYKVVPKTLTQYSSNTDGERKDDGMDS